MCHGERSNLLTLTQETHTHTYIHTHTHSQTCTHTHTHTHTNTHALSHTCTRIHTRSYIHTNTRSHIQTHACAHTHLHACDIHAQVRIHMDIFSTFDVIYLSRAPISSHICSLGQPVRFKAVRCSSAGHPANVSNYLIGFG